MVKAYILHMHAPSGSVRENPVEVIDNIQPDECISLLTQKHPTVEKGPELSNGIHLYAVGDGVKHKWNRVGSKQKPKKGYHDPYRYLNKFKKEHSLDVGTFALHGWLSMNQQEITASLLQQFKMQADLPRIDPDGVMRQDLANLGDWLYEQNLSGLRLGFEVKSEGIDVSVTKPRYRRFDIEERISDLMPALIYHASLPNITGLTGEIILSPRSYEATIRAVNPDTGWEHQRVATLGYFQTYAQFEDMEKVSGESALFSLQGMLEDVDHFIEVRHSSNLRNKLNFEEFVGDYHISFTGRSGPSSGDLTGETREILKGKLRPIFSDFCLSIERKSRGMIAQKSDYEDIDPSDFEVFTMNAEISGQAINFDAQFPGAYGFNLFDVSFGSDEMDGLKDIKTEGEVAELGH